ncbi:hypothetical protein Taro_011921 [Colocasia esculenta]|uniref:Uncharacterized protein n=1 Tax=Colocasia esculenta TaxID=4460 RepID=A0A843U7C0_COLES|nr:hypothetical protein [Colocasia esculenta]
MGRAPCCDKANVKRGPWSPEEDAKLKSYIEQHGTGDSWISLPQKIGLKRCGKSCRLRWLNYLRPDIKHGGFSEEEDNIICRLYVSIGSRWSVIAAQLPGRTDNDVKNYWNTRLKKKLFLGSGRLRKEQQHGRRRLVGSPKKEAKQMEKGRSFTPAAEDGSWRDPHRPQLEVPVQNQELPTATAGHPSTEQFPGGHSGQLFGDSLAQPDCHGFLDDLIPLSSLAVPLGSSSPSPPGGHISQGAGAWCLTPELEEMFCYNTVRLEGLDGFYGVDNMVLTEGSRTTTSSESLSWEEIMSPLACPPLISGYQPMYPPQQQQ